MTKPLLALLLALLLTACGGGDNVSIQLQGPRQLATQAQGQASIDYSELVQMLYVGYFGRPADPTGLQNFSTQLGGITNSPYVEDLERDYKTSEGIRALVDSFGVSAESQALYNGGTSNFVTSIYRNLLNRVPPPGDDGQAFWVNAVDNAGLQRSKAALSILTGALANKTPQGLIDAQVIQNRVAMAKLFTRAANANIYKGTAPAALARGMLALVDQNTSAAAMQPIIDQTLTDMALASGNVYAGVYIGTLSGGDTGIVSFTINGNGAVSGYAKTAKLGVQRFTGNLTPTGNGRLLQCGFGTVYICSGTVTTTGDFLVGFVLGGLSGTTMAAQRVSN